ncbi:Uncharacterized protein SCG7086_AD_00230 [Chlamydiales bacterium SCGC AG-110-P3]|nr:Uncharacterized protein SCG7086_AD_00230 [Chlamydiales bacterium SCGC AG-110-P3]
MKDPRSLKFHCQECEAPVTFDLFELESDAHPCIVCLQCGKEYLFKDETLQRQLGKFVALCRQIRDSEEILGETSIGITLGDRDVEIPYKLLLTRLNSKLNLDMGGQTISITFRAEPTASTTG